MYIPYSLELYIYIYTKHLVHSIVVYQIISRFYFGIEDWSFFMPRPRIIFVLHNVEYSA